MTLSVEKKLAVNDKTGRDNRTGWERHCRPRSRARHSRTVYLNADRNVPYGAIVRVMERSVGRHPGCRSHDRCRS